MVAYAMDLDILVLAFMVEDGKAESLDTIQQFGKYILVFTTRIPIEQKATLGQGVKASMARVA